MLSIIFLTLVAALLGVTAVFMLMAKDHDRSGQSGLPGISASSGKQGRASGLD